MPPNTTYGTATTSAAGLMSAAMVTKLNGIATGATKNTVDSALSSTSTNPVQNKVVNAALEEINSNLDDLCKTRKVLFNSTITTSLTSCNLSETIENYRFIDIITTVYTSQSVATVFHKTIPVVELKNIYNETNYVSLANAFWTNTIYIDCCATKFTSNRFMASYAGTGLYSVAVTVVGIK